MPRLPRNPITDPKTGVITPEWLRALQDVIDEAFPPAPAPGTPPPSTPPGGGGGGGGSSDYGTGTAGKITKWLAAHTLGDSIISESGAVITIAGDLIVNNITGSFDPSQINTGGVANAFFLTNASAVASFSPSVPFSVWPTVSDAFDLGNAGARYWRNSYLSGASVFTNGQAPPAVMTADTAAFYAADVSGTVRMFAIDEAGVTGQVPTLTGTLTAGSVLFASANGQIDQNNAALFWDNAGQSFGIGTNAPTSLLHVRKAFTNAFLTAQTDDSASRAQLAMKADSGSFLIAQYGAAVGGTLYGVSLNSLSLLQATSAAFGHMMLDYSNTASNAACIWANGIAETMRLTQTGNLGVGTAAPTSRLTVKAAGTGTSPAFEIRDSNNNQRLFIDAAGSVLHTFSATAFFKIVQRDTSVYGWLGNATDYFFNYDTAAQRVIVGNTATFGSRFGVTGNASIGSTYVATAAPTNGLIVEGNVGIGTASPLQKLQVGATADTTSTVVRITNDGASANGNPTLSLFRAGVTEAFISYVNSVSPKILIGESPAGYTTAALVAAAKVTIDVGPGFVGIGTTTPETLLDVFGHVKVRDAFRLQWGASASGTAHIIGLAGAAGYLAFSVFGSEVARLAASAKLLVGSTFASAGTLSLSHSAAIQNSLGIGTTLLQGAGTNTAVFADGTAPSAMATNTAGLYAEDVGGTVKMFVIDEAGVTGEIATVGGTSVGGSGTTGKIPKWSSSSALTDSIIVESSGKIGIGVTPTTPLHVLGSVMKLDNTASGFADVQIFSKNGSDSYINFLENSGNTWAIGLDASASGNFVIGANTVIGSASDWLTITQAGLLTVPAVGYHAFGASSGDSRVTVRSNATYHFGAMNASGNGYFFGATSAASPDAVWSNNAGTEHMRLSDAGHLTITAGGNGLTCGATGVASGAYVQSYNGAAYQPLSLLGSVVNFYSNGTERGRVTTAGNLSWDSAILVNTTATAGLAFNAECPLNALTLMVLQTTQSPGGGAYIQFNNLSAAAAGSITHTGATTVAYNTSSDARLKRSLGIATQTDVLRQTLVHDFAWIADGTRARGMFAQEAQVVAPFAVTVGSDDRTVEGHLAKPWAIDYSKYVPDLIVGWQDHEARLAAIERKQKEAHD